MEDKKLLPCPHCGGSSDLKWDSDADDVWVECHSCHARGPLCGRCMYGFESNLESVFQAVDGWNKRYTGKEAVPDGELPMGGGC